MLNENTTKTLHYSRSLRWRTWHNYMSAICFDDTKSGARNNKKKKNNNIVHIRVHTRNKI